MKFTDSVVRCSSRIYDGANFGIFSNFLWIWVVYELLVVSLPVVVSKYFWTLFSLVDVESSLMMRKRLLSENRGSVDAL